MDASFLIAGYGLNAKISLCLDIIPHQLSMLSHLRSVAAMCRTHTSGDPQEVESTQALIAFDKKIQVMEERAARARAGKVHKKYKKGKKANLQTLPCILSPGVRQADLEDCGSEGDADLDAGWYLAGPVASKDHDDVGMDRNGDSTDPCSTSSVRLCSSSLLEYLGADDSKASNPSGSSSLPRADAKTAEDLGDEPGTDRPEAEELSLAATRPGDASMPSRSQAFGSFSTPETKVLGLAAALSDLCASPPEDAEAASQCSGEASASSNLNLHSDASVPSLPQTCGSLTPTGAFEDSLVPRSPTSIRARRSVLARMRHFKSTRVTTETASTASSHPVHRTKSPRTPCTLAIDTED